MIDATAFTAVAVCTVCNVRAERDCREQARRWLARHTADNHPGTVAAKRASDAHRHYTRKATA